MPANIAAEHEYLALEIRRSSDQHNKEDGKPAAGFGSRIHALFSVGKRYCAKFARVNANVKAWTREGNPRIAPRDAVSDAAGHVTASEGKSQNLFVETGAGSAKIRIPRLCCSFLSTSSSL